MVDEDVNEMLGLILKWILKTLLFRKWIGLVWLVSTSAGLVGT
jgi:hypothetical protein